MKRIFIVVTALVMVGVIRLSAPLAQEATIFNNFDVGYTYNVNLGWSLVVGEPYPTAIEFIQGDAFTPVGSDFTLNTIELVGWLDNGPNELDVWLMSDGGGLPGEVIEAFHFSDAMGPGGGLINPVLMGSSVLNPTLKEGTQYWLIASLTGPDASGAWNMNSIGDIGPHAVLRSDLGAWGVSNQESGVFRITGTPVKEVAIDIEPGRDPNYVKPGSGRKIPVAILTTETFDATTVNPLSVKFGPNGALETHGQGHVKDVDGDGDLDLLLHFISRETGIQCGDTTASLTGKTFAMLEITGTDSIVTRGCK